MDNMGIVIELFAMVLLLIGISGKLERIAKALEKE